MDEYIPTAEHHLNLVERAHPCLLDIIRAIRMDNKFQSFKSALAEAAFCYNTSVHRSTGFAPATLHTGHLLFSPDLLHPDNTLPLPPAATGPDHRGFVAKLDNFRELACGVVDFNRAEAQRRTEQYYTQLTLQLKKGSLVLVLQGGHARP